MKNNPKEASAPIRFHLLTGLWITVQYLLPKRNKAWSDKLQSI